MTEMTPEQVTYDIMVDIDDVVMPWADTVHAACDAACLVPPGTKWSTWNMWKDYGCTQEEWSDVVSHLVANGLYLNTEPYNGAAQGINLMRFAGHRVHIVTARGFMANADLIRTQTPEWLAEFGIGYDSLVFAKDKAKAMRALGVHFDYAIDDGVHNYEILDEAGVEVWLHTQPHNMTHETPRRVASLWEFAKKIVLKEEL